VADKQSELDTSFKNWGIGQLGSQKQARQFGTSLAYRDAGP
jgi:hypothetical protein